MSESLSSFDEPLVVLFDDERRFISGFRDGAIVLRTVAEARRFFDYLKLTKHPVSELWLDFVIGRGNVTEALSDLPGELVERAFYHSSGIAGRSLVETWLKRQGFTGELELPEGQQFE